MWPGGEIVKWILKFFLKDGMVRSDTAVGTPDYISPEVRYNLPILNIFFTLSTYLRCQDMSSNELYNLNIFGKVSPRFITEHDFWNAEMKRKNIITCCQNKWEFLSVEVTWLVDLDPYLFSVSKEDVERLMWSNSCHAVTLNVGIISDTSCLKNISSSLMCLR